MVDVEDIKISASNKIENFVEILKSIECSDTQKKLWKEIYENAILDREKSESLLHILLEITKNSSSEHAVHGKSISSYLEKMAKCNDQLLKLSELMSDADPSGDTNANDIYGKISES